MLKKTLRSVFFAFLPVFLQISFIYASSQNEIRSGETRSSKISGPAFIEAWTFRGEAGARVIITAVATSGFLNTEIYLYPPDGGPLEATSNPSGDKLDHRLKKSGEYTAIVQDFFLDDEGNYNITLIKIPGEATSAEDPDGGAMASGKTAQGNIVASDLDAYLFWGNAGDRIVITAAPSTSSFLNTELYLYPPAGDSLEATTSPSGDRLDHQLEKTGVYTVIVQDFFLDDSGHYNISFLKIPGAVSSPNDLDGGDLVSGMTAAGKIIAADMDAYQFYGQAGDRVVITASSASGFLNTELYLYPPDGAPSETTTNPSGDRLDH